MINATKKWIFLKISGAILIPLMIWFILNLISIYDEDYLNVSFINGDKVLDKYFEIPLMDIESQLLDIQSEESNVDVIVVSKDFCDLINQLNIFNDTLQLEFTESQVMFLANGSDGTMKVNINLNDFIEYAIQEDFELICFVPLP